MKYLKYMLFWIMAATITGCGFVYTPQPIGERPSPIETDAWEGTWINGEQFLTINVLDETKGLLRISWIANDNGQVKLESSNLHLLESGDWTFASIPDKDNPKQYLWGRIKQDERQVVVWVPDSEKFKSLVEEGKLPGKIDNKNVMLGNLTLDHLKLITSETEGVLFEWDEPIIFQKFKSVPNCCGRQLSLRGTPINRGRLRDEAISTR